MAISLNKVILVGHLTQDPELKQTQSGISVTSFSIGVARKYQKGEASQSDFLKIVAWRNTAEFITKYFRKGHPICICGSITTRQYSDQNGTKHTVTEIVADEASFIASKNEMNGENSVPAFSTPSADAFVDVNTDDDLPF